jgi:copper transport protein
MGAVLALTLVVSVAGAGAAFAHATLDSTDPVGGTALSVSPPDLEVHFSESVTLESGSLRLFDGTGAELHLRSTSHPDGATVRAVPPTLRAGAYVVAWRVVSADGHPVHGAFTFRIGAGDQASPTLINHLLAQGGGSSLVGALLSVARFLSFMAVAVVVGGLALSAGFGLPSIRARRVMMVAAALAVLGGIVALALQAPYGSGGGLGDVFNGSAWREVFNSRLGWTWVIRIALVGVLGVAALRPPRRTALGAMVVVAALVMFGAEAWGGHGSTGRWTAVAFVATLVHLGSVSVWFGGLVFLAVQLRDPGARKLATRFSRWATVSVIALIVSGSVQAWRQLGSLHAITSTTYGRLLLIKVGAVAVMLLAASNSRRIALYPTTADEDPDDPEVEARDRRLLRNPIAVEVSFGVVVFAATSLLVVAQPAIADANRTFTTTLVQGTTLADISATPLRPGANILHVTISSTGGGLADLPTAIAVTITLPSRDVGPLPVPVVGAGPGHVIATAQVPFPGTWEVDIAATYDKFTEKDFTTKLDIR